MTAQNTRLNFARVWQTIARFRSDAARYAYSIGEYENAKTFQLGAATAYERMDWYRNRFLGISS